jgi:hypothetical protein
METGCGFNGLRARWMRRVVPPDRDGVVDVRGRDGFWGWRDGPLGEMGLKSHVMPWVMLEIQKALVCVSGVAQVARVYHVPIRSTFLLRLVCWFRLSKPRGPDGIILEESPRGTWNFRSDSSDGVGTLPMIF